MVIGRHVEALAFLDVILGDKPPLEPPETFYQRALEGKALAMATGARKRIATSSFADYFDKVAMPGLALAQGELARDDTAFRAARRDPSSDRGSARQAVRRPLDPVR